MSAQTYTTEIEMIRIKLIETMNYLLHSENENNRKIKELESANARLESKNAELVSVLNNRLTEMTDLYIGLVSDVSSIKNSSLFRPQFSNNDFPSLFKKLEATQSISAKHTFESLTTEVPVLVPVIPNIVAKSTPKILVKPKTPKVNVIPNVVKPKINIIPNIVNPRTPPVLNIILNKKVEIPVVLTEESISEESITEESEEEIEEDNIIYAWDKDGNERQLELEFDNRDMIIAPISKFQANGNPVKDREIFYASDELDKWLPYIQLVDLKAIRASANTLLMNKNKDHPKKDLIIKNRILIDRAISNI